MKITLAAFVGALLLSGVAMAKDTTTAFMVSGWHCEGCSGKTVSALTKVKGVKDATADVETKRLVVTYDDTEVKEADIAKTVMSLHYKVVLAK